MPFIELNGLTFHLQELGATGKPVLMLHSAFGSLAQWYFTAAPELAKRCNVLLVDMRGHGLSSRPPSGYRVEHFAGDTVALLEAKFRQPITIIGYSLGAAVALRASVGRPDLIERLLLIEPPVPITLGTFGWRKGLDFATAARALTDENGPMNDQSSDLRAQVRQGLLGKRRRMGSANAIYEQTTMLDELSSGSEIPDEMLKAFHRRVVLIIGRDSHLLGPSERLLGLLPYSERLVLEGTHALPLEQPGRLREAMEGFLHG